MTNPSRRGSAPNCAQPDYARPGSFEPGQQKRGGRKRGTPNIFSNDYKKAIFEAAWRIGEDGNGKDGIVGYFKWIGMHHSSAYAVLLMNWLTLELAGAIPPEQPHRTKEELDQSIRDYIGLEGANRTRETDQVEARLQWDWTGQPFPVGPLMQLAVNDPKEFCKTFAAALMRPPTKRRGLAAQHPWFS